MGSCLSISIALASIHEKNICVRCKKTLTNENNQYIQFKKMYMCLDCNEFIISTT